MGDDGGGGVAATISTATAAAAVVVAVGRKMEATRSRKWAVTDEDDDGGDADVAQRLDSDGFKSTSLTPCANNNRFTSANACLSDGLAAALADKRPYKTAAPVMLRLLVVVVAGV